MFAPIGRPLFPVQRFVPSILLVLLSSSLHLGHSCPSSSPSSLPSSPPSFFELCDLKKDVCPFDFNGVCDNERGGNVSDCRGGDCWDCDQCKRFQGNCTQCVENGCYWCPGSLSCYESPHYFTYYDFSTIQECVLPSDFTQTCPNNYFTNDPAYPAQEWALDMINVLPVWEKGIFGKGVRIRFNGGGVDASHQEFEGRFDVAASCDQYLPQLIEDGLGLTEHGTYVASIAASAANNSFCVTGIAPEATLSACEIYVTEGFEYIDEKLELFDISQNSYNLNSCDLSRRRRLRRKVMTTMTTPPPTPAAAATTTTTTTSSACPFQFVNGAGQSPCTFCTVPATSQFVYTDSEDANATAAAANNDTTAIAGMFSTESSLCQAAIFDHCDLYYEFDPDACLEYLDLYLPLGKCFYNSLTTEQRTRFKNGIENGRNGKGTVYIFSAGNEYSKGEDVNFEGYLNSRYTITVAAVGKDEIHASYSTPGAAVFLSGPGGDNEFDSNLYGAASGGRCGGGLVGTSFAAPAVSGVVALMLQVNPNLGWRDVQGILAKTARVIVDPADNERITNAAGFTHSNFYGFGIVNADAAVAAAESWENWDEEHVIHLASDQNLKLFIPDYPSEAVTSKIDVNEKKVLNDMMIEGADDFVVESVVVHLNVTHESRGDLEITLTSPAGTLSIINPGNRPENQQPSDYDWELLTLKNWGESPFGKWTLSVLDRSQGGGRDRCADYFPWLISITVFDVSCIDLEIAGICFDGTVNLNVFDDFAFDEQEAQLFKDDFLNGRDIDNGFLAQEACCACGGGYRNQNVLMSWSLEIFGRPVYY